MDKKKKTYSLLLFSVALVWGVGFPIQKFALNLGMPTSFINVYRFSIASVFLFILFYKQIKNLTKKQILFGLLAAFVLAVGFQLQTLGMSATSSANSSLITGFGVVMVPFLSWIFFKTRPSIRAFIGAALCFISLSLLSIFGLSAFNVGDLLTLFCAIAFALHYIVLDRAANKVPSGALAFMQMAFATIFFLIYELAFDFSSFALLPTVDYRAYLLALELALFSTCYAYIIQSTAQKYLSPTTSSILLSGESLFGAAFSVILGLETLSWMLAAATIGVTASIIIVEYSPKTDIQPSGDDIHS